MESDSNDQNYLCSDKCDQKVDRRLGKVAEEERQRPTDRQTGRDKRIKNKHCHNSKVTLPEFV